MNGAEDGYVNESKESSEAGISKMMGEPNPPGVTVRIWHGNPGYTECLISLDGVPKEVFSAVTRVSTDDPEAAEAECREKVALLLARCLGFEGMHPDDVQLTFVREL